MSREQLEAVFDAVEWQMAVLDGDGTVVRVNEAWRRFGRENDADPRPETSAEGANYLRACRGTAEPGDGEDRDDEGDPVDFSGERAARGIEEVLAGRRDGFRMEYPCHAPGRKRWFLMSVKPLGDGDGAVVTHIDITERKTAEDELTHKALHDPLTDLPNRRLFTDRFRQALARQDRGAGRTAVAYVDLDDFKRINDTFGHDAGDEILRGVARRIESAVREGDTAARLGGDEFAVLLPGVAGPAAAEEAARRVIRGIEEPAEYRGREVVIEASAGIALAGPGPTDPEELVKEADRAMYRAKELGVKTRVAGESAAAG